MPRPWFAAAALLGLLAGCGERREPPVEPPPLGHQQQAQAAPQGAPNTAELGAGRAPGACAVATQQVLALVNAARAAGHRCGSHSMRPAGPLVWNEALFSAAQGHSLDMAKRNYFEHSSPEGSRVSDRVSAARYNWKHVGENIAGGDESIDEAVQGWLDSPDHCENMMDPQFNDIAVACAAQPGTQWGTYWTMVLGRKR